MKLFTRLSLGAALGLALSTAAVAAPFCTVSNFGTNCAYFDMQSCQQAAAGLRGTCVVEPNKTIFGNTQSLPGAPFCVVSAVGTQCFYQDAPSCQQAAAQVRGACVVNPNR